MTMDLSEHVAPKSDQLDAVDLLSGSRVFTVERVSQGDADQPFNFHFAEFPRPWRPGLSMRRVLLACWGKDASTFVGRRIELFCDPTVQFGGQAVGGIRIKRLSHLAKKQSVPLLVSRGKSAMWTVEPLPDAVPSTSPAVSAGTLDKLTATFRRKGVPEDRWLAGANHYTGGAATALEVLTEDQARRVLAELAKRPNAEPAEAPRNASRNDKSSAEVPVDPCPVCGADTGRDEPHDDAVHEAAGA